MRCSRSVSESCITQLASTIIKCAYDASVPGSIVGAEGDTTNYLLASNVTSSQPALALSIMGR
jgi:hypothetical protein